MQGFTTNPAPWDCTQSGRKEAEDVRATVQCEIQEDDVVSECLRQQKPEEKEEQETENITARQTTAQYWQIEEVVDTAKSYKWLDEAGLKGGTEAVIMAAQERAILRINILFGG